MDTTSLSGAYQTRWIWISACMIIMLVMGWIQPSLPPEWQQQTHMNVQDIVGWAESPTHHTLTWQTCLQIVSFLIFTICSCFILADLYKSWNYVQMLKQTEAGQNAFIPPAGVVIVLLLLPIVQIPWIFVAFPLLVKHANKMLPLASPGAKPFPRTASFVFSFASFLYMILLIIGMVFFFYFITSLIMTEINPTMQAPSMSITMMFISWFIYALGALYALVTLSLIYTYKTILRINQTFSGLPARG